MSSRSGGATDAARGCARAHGLPCRLPGTCSGSRSSIAGCPGSSRWPPMSVATLPEARRRPFVAPPVPVIAIAAIAVFVLFVGATLAVAGSTLGFDFLAYHAAAVRVLHAQPLFDTSFTAAGSFGLFYYPPTFLPLILPFGLLEPTVATWTWTAILLGAFALGIAVLPVSIRTRWLIVLLAGLSWPFVYAVKLGQVGPLLFLAFAIGWRTLDRPLPLGVSTAAGTAIKLQPGVVFVWALLTRRWRAVVIGLAVLVALAVAATVLSGARIWPDFITLAQRVSNPITLEHNLTPGAVLYRLRVPPPPPTPPHPPPRAPRGAFVGFAPP